MHLKLGGVVISFEIRFNYNLAVANGNYNVSQNEADQWDQSAVGAASGIAATTTSAANLSYGSVSTANVGFLLLKNLDTTNAVSWGYDSSGFVAIGKLKPGEVAFFRVTPSLQLQLKAAAGTPNVQYWLLRD